MFCPKIKLDVFFPPEKPSGLISIYLAGEDKSTKKCSPHYRINHLTSIALLSTSSIPTMAQFSPLDEFQTFSGQKSGGAS